MDINLFRPEFQIGFRCSNAERKRQFVETVERAAPVVEGPHFNITQMTPEDLERLPKFHYYG